MLNFLFFVYIWLMILIRVYKSRGWTHMHWRGWWLILPIYRWPWWWWHSKWVSPRMHSHWWPSRLWIASLLLWIIMHPLIRIFISWILLLKLIIWWLKIIWWSRWILLWRKVLGRSRCLRLFSFICFSLKPFRCTIVVLYHLIKVL